MLDRLHASLRSRPFLQRFTLVTRTLLAVGFVAPGLTKVVGRAFAPGIDPTTPMGAYFEAFHGTAGYYVFVGLAQVVAGTLLLSRRTALLGACLYTAIITNIFVLVTATQFGTGTPIVTGLMTLGALWLLAWDGHRLAPLFGPTAPRGNRPQEPAIWDTLAPRGATGPMRWSTRAAYVVGTAGALAFTLLARGFGSSLLLKYTLSAVLAAGLITLGVWASHGVGRLRSALSSL